MKLSPITQYNFNTCQSACLLMCLRLFYPDFHVTDIQIYDELSRHGVAGDPHNMEYWVDGQLDELPYRVDYDMITRASIEDIICMLSSNSVVVIHTFVTPAGHVVCIDDYSAETDCFHVVDPRAPLEAWSGWWSAELLHAVAVEAYTFEQAKFYYTERHPVHRDSEQAWVHCFSPVEKPPATECTTKVVQKTPDRLCDPTPLVPA
jgi:hypothetical protein